MSDRATWIIVANLWILAGWALVAFDKWPWGPEAFLVGFYYLVKAFFSTLAPDERKQEASK